MKMSTFSTSIHCRAMLTAMSGLFWWSAEITSIFQPLAASPESSTAIWAARVEPGAAEVGVETGIIGQHADLDVLVLRKGALPAPNASAVPSKTAEILCFMCISVDRA
jgi:hypothetical protein